MFTTAHQFILDHAPEYHVDSTRIVLAGDSAAAQLSSQMGLLGWGDDISMWAYAGDRDLANSPTSISFDSTSTPRKQR